MSLEDLEDYKYKKHSKYIIQDKPPFEEENYEKLLTNLNQKYKTSIINNFSDQADTSDTPETPSGLINKIVAMIENIEQLNLTDKIDKNNDYITDKIDKNNEQYTKNQLHNSDYINIQIRLNNLNEIDKSKQHTIYLMYVLLTISISIFIYLIYL